MKLLLVEDNHGISQNIAFILRHSGYVLDLSTTYSDALTKSRDNDYDAIILDWMLPDGSGVDLCRILRQEGFQQSILLLTAKNQLDDLVTGLDAGADDYMTKPFDMVELLARLRSLLRRRETPWTPAMLTVGNLTFNSNTGMATREKKTITLRPKEQGLLEYLIRNKNMVVSKDELLEHLWDEKSDVLSNTIEVHIRYLREKIDMGFSKPLIQTVKGKGYMICDK